MAKIIVGIDFGTSTTVVRWRKEDSDELHVIKDCNGQTVIDSAIFVPEDSEDWIFGRNAMNQGNRKGELVLNFKMNLIEPDPEKNKQAEVYVRRFMTYVYKQFTQQTLGVNYDSMDVFVSYPVKWPLEKKTLMKRIVADSGFGMCTGVSIVGKTEPVAAAIELMRIHTPHLVGTGILRANSPLNVMMLDMGAGTSDLFLFQMSVASDGEIVIPEDKIAQYPVSEQPYNCGGREIDAKISKEILDYLSKGMQRTVKETWFDMPKAKDWKDQTLSDSLKGGTMVAEMPIAITPIIEQAEDYGMWDKTVGDYRMSRSKFETLTEDHWSNLYKLVRSGMARFKDACGIGAEDIDIIFLTGGHSQWYCIPNLFNGTGVGGTVAVESDDADYLNFTKIVDGPWRILQGENPRETVANGLCWPNIIKMPFKAENNVWIRVGTNGLYSKYKQIVSKGEILPCSVRITDDEPEYNTVVITQNTIFASDKFYVEFEVLEGEDIENSAKSIFKCVIDKESILGKLLVILITLGTSILTTSEYRISYLADVELKEDGTLAISGQLNLNGKKERIFSEKNLIVS